MRNDDDLYTLVRAEFEPVRLPHQLADITARGRGLRRQRRAARAIAVVGLTAALAAGLTLTLRPTTRQPTKPAGPVQLAAWSVDTRPGSDVVLTIRQLTHAEDLTATLKNAGVPALVEFKKIDGAHTHLLGCEARQPALPQLDNVMPPQGQHSNGTERVFTIHRSALPAATSLHFVIFYDVSDYGVPAQSVRISLVHGNPIPCKLLT